jgi:hypothetical protein
MSTPAHPAVLGLDFGTTNSVAALSRGGDSQLVPFVGPAEASPVFRSALCFWEDEGGVAVEAGPWAIAEYLEYPEGSRFIQSFKTVAASSSFEHATIFGKRYRFEDLGRILVEKMSARSGGALDGGAARVVIGRPVEYAGHRPTRASPASATRPYSPASAPRSIMFTSRWALRSASPPGLRNRPPCWSPISEAAPATFRWCGSPRPAPPGAACRSVMPASALPATGSTIGSSTIW